MFFNGRKYEFGCGEFDGYGVSEKSVKNCRNSPEVEGWGPFLTSSELIPSGTLWGQREGGALLYSTRSRGARGVCIFSLARLRGKATVGFHLRGQNSKEPQD